MGIPRFRNHPIIREFNGLKRFFRHMETGVSRQRVAHFKRFCMEAEARGEDLAFDIMGSVNFGQAHEHSDTDMVVYARCDEHLDDDCNSDCRKVKELGQIIHEGLVLSGPFQALQIVDWVNLTRMDRDLDTASVDSGLLIRFGFYRAVCRGVNRKLLRQYETRLARSPVLCEQIESSLTGCFLGLIHSSQHAYSFRKYIERVEAEGYKISPSMAAKIREYLGH